MMKRAAIPIILILFVGIIFISGCTGDEKMCKVADDCILAYVGDGPCGQCDLSSPEMDCISKDTQEKLFIKRESKYGQIRCAPCMALEQEFFYCECVGNRCEKTSYCELDTDCPRDYANCINSTCYYIVPEEQNIDDAGNIIIDINEIDEHVNEEVVIEGCLKFACPTVVGASYPEDCIVYIEDDAGQINALIFDESTSHLRELADNAYQYEFSICVETWVKGVVIGNICDSDSPGCVSTYDVDVIDLKTCVDIDGGRLYYTSSGFRSPCPPDVPCGVFGEYCDGNRLHEEWCEHGKIKEEYYNCSNGCSNGACNPE